MVQKDAEQESEMRAEIQEMKKEQSSISMMDEFARYARLERKINKTTDKLKTHGEEKAIIDVQRIDSDWSPQNEATEWGAITVQCKSLTKKCIFCIIYIKKRRFFLFGTH